MINGKFFSGLPEKMMEKSTGPNRQKTNFYWPDESNTESVAENKSKRQHQGTPQVKSSPLNNDPSLQSSSHSESNIQPKDLFKKQLTSKIEFYDTMIDTTDSKTVLPSEKQKPRNDLIKNKMNETFTSKIQFYDYADNYPSDRVKSSSITSQSLLKTLKNDKNSKTELEKNSKNSPKFKDKRIKFIETETEQNDVKKGILKNNETTSVHVHNHQSTTKLGQDKQQNKKTSLMEKKFFSKSVENLARSKSVGDFVSENSINNNGTMNSIKIIENDVKKLNLREQNQYNCDDHNDIDDNNGGNNENTNDRKNEILQQKQKISSKSGQLMQDYNNISVQNNKVDNCEIKHETRLSNNHNGKPDFNNIGKREKLQQGINEQKNEGHHDEIVTSNGLKLSSDHDNRSRNSIERSSMLTTNTKVNRSSGDKVERVDRAHRHLVSNISSILYGSNDNDNERTTKTHKTSARNSAVQRVSVGLPD